MNSRLKQFMPSLESISDVDVTESEAVDAALLDNADALVASQEALAGAQATYWSLEALREELSSTPLRTVTTADVAGMESAYLDIASTSAARGLELPALVVDESSMNGTRGRAGLESVSGAIGRALTAVLNAIKTMIANFTALLERVSPALRLLGMSLYRLQERLRGVAARHAVSDEVQIGRWAGLLSRERQATKAGPEFIRALDDLRSQAQVVSTGVTSSIESAVDKYTQLLSGTTDFSNDGLDRLGEEISKILDRYSPAKLGSSFRSQERITDPRWPDGSATAATPLPGQRSLVFVNVAPDPGASLTDRLRAQMRSGMTLTRLAPNSARDYTDATMGAMTFTELRTAMDLLKSLFTIVEGQIIGGQRNRVRTAGKKMVDAVVKIESAVEDRSSHVARLIAVSGTLSGWITNPYIAMLSHSIAVLTAYTRVMEIQVRNYGG